MMTQPDTRAKIARTIRHLMERDLKAGIVPEYARVGASHEEQIAAWAQQPDSEASRRVTAEAVRLHGGKAGGSLRDEVRREVFACLRAGIERTLKQNSESARHWLEEIEREWRAGS